MNEELQAMNDELQLSNQALREHQEEVDRLNDFMVSVLESMDSGVAVVDRDLRVLAWNARAHDLWGVRADEAIGSHLLNLDIGLPVEPLRESLRAQLGSDDLVPAVVELPAVNRRGRALTVKVTITALQGRRADAPAAMLMMEVVDPVDG